MSEEFYLDPNKIYAEQLEPWQAYWDSELSFYENLFSLASQSVVLPKQSIQLPIAIAYSLVSSKWAKILPILFSWGDKGTGKSTFAILASKIHGIELCSSADTFASIRNNLDCQRWIDLETKDFEKDGAILCWDNIHAQTLKEDKNIYALLLQGYNRATERISIAQPDGTNRVFRVFCPKIISSVQPLHNYWELEELQRRLLIIRHKAIEKMTPDDLESTEPISGDDLLNLDSINWDGLSTEYLKFWTEADNAKRYASVRAYLTKKGKKSWELPGCITATRWTILVDLIATGTVFGIWQSYQDAINHFADYYEFMEAQTSLSQSNTYYLVGELLKERFDSLREPRNKLLTAGFSAEPFKLPASQLKEFLAHQDSEGALDISRNDRNAIKEIMRSHGFQLQGNSWVEVL